MKSWSTEPFIGGSYSGPSLNSTEDDYLHLAEPVAGCVFFAGEATCVDMPTTVSAAVTTGERAAQEVLTNYKVQI